MNLCRQRLGVNGEEGLGVGFRCHSRDRPPALHACRIKRDFAPATLWNRRTYRPLRRRRSAFTFTRASLSGFRGMGRGDPAEDQAKSPEHANQRRRRVALRLMTLPSELCPI